MNDIALKIGNNICHIRYAHNMNFCIHNQIELSDHDRFNKQTELNLEKGKSEAFKITNASKLDF